MKIYLKRLPRKLQGLIRLAEESATRDGIPVYLVGGFVRDLILGVKNLDLDLVVEGDGIRLAELIAAHVKAKLIRHRRFGTATVVIGPGLKVDIATARKETYPEPGSLPSVTFGMLRDDLKRRDFTINAMAISINRDDYGKLVDFFDGRGDVRKKKIRILHDQSFMDDPTRIVRAVRFEQRYNFRIEPRTLKLIKEAAECRMLERVQPQRLRDDLVLLLKEKDPLKHIRRLEGLVGLGFISPHIKVPYAFLKAVEKEIQWFLKTYPQRRALDTWLIYFMGVTDMLTAGDTEKACQRFVLRKGETKRIATYKKIDRDFIRHLSARYVSPARIFVLLEPLSYEVILLLKAKFRNRAVKKHIVDFLEIYNGMRLCISGHDLHRLGVSPGPYYQKIFTKVLHSKLNGRLKTRSDELAFIKQIVTR